jgi:hypothetical protein
LSGAVYVDVGTVSSLKSPRAIALFVDSTPCHEVDMASYLACVAGSRGVKVLNDGAVLAYCVYCGKSPGVPPLGRRGGAEEPMVVIF